LPLSTSFAMSSVTRPGETFAPPGVRGDGGRELLGRGGRRSDDQRAPQARAGDEEAASRRAHRIRPGS
jgi:hypothetical protein